MVLGLRSKKGTPVSLVYDLVLQEVKPWPSKSIPSSVIILWQRGEKRSGYTKCITPERDRLTFNHSLRLPATLYKLSDNKRNGQPKFQKKCVVFILYEAQADKTPRGQPLGRAVLDLADYGNLERTATSSIVVAVAKKEFSSLGPPALSFTISPARSGAPLVARAPSMSSTSDAKSTEVTESRDSLIASLLSDEEDDIHSFTDDDEPSACSTPASEPAKPSSPSPPQAQAPSPAPTPVSTTKDAPPDKNDVRTERVQRILSSVALPSPAKAAASAAASAYASRKIARASSSSELESTSDEGQGSPNPPTITLPAVLTKSNKSGATVSNLKAPEVEQRGKVIETPRTTRPEVDEVSVLQAARMKYAEGAGERTEKLDKKAVEEARLRAANAEAKAAAAEERARILQMEMEDLKGELRDAAALEVALYSVAAQHGSSPQKTHSPARRLARIYIHACKYSSQDRRASTARNCASGLVVVARACENDVSRLTFWWSNVVVLRGMILQAFASAGANGNALKRKESQTGSRAGVSSDWRETKTLTSTLERIEAWIFGRIVESIWWQSLTPHMQASFEQSVPPSPTSSVDVSVVTRLKKSVRGLIATDFGETKQGSQSVEIWKSAFLDALQRLCPVRAGGHDCGCLKMATKLIIEQCVARLDVAMFNAILRDDDEGTPTDPVSDPISELSVLPISPNAVSFSGGAQLKNVISTWSTWLLSQTTEGAGADAQEVLDKASPYFTLLRAMSDLLMLPKDMLMDKSVRKEVCPALSLLLIRRILSKFVPDEFSPEEVPPSLLAALNAEISMESQRVGEAELSSTTVVMASAPPVIYFPPDAASLITDLAPESTGNSAKLSRNASLIRKGYTSDDELEEIESPLFLLVESSGNASEETAAPPVKDASAKRYNLLREAWRQQQ